MLNSFFVNFYQNFGFLTCYCKLFFRKLRILKIQMRSALLIGCLTFRFIIFGLKLTGNYLSRCEFSRNNEKFLARNFEFSRNKVHINQRIRKNRKNIIFLDEIIKINFLSSYRFGAIFGENSQNTEKFGRHGFWCEKFRFKNVKILV